MSTPTSAEALKQVVLSGDFLVLDTETTGVYDAEVCQIAIIDSGGRVLLDTLVRPRGSIPEAATKVHGITDDLVALAPGWEKVSDKVVELIAGNNIISYNAAFDRRVMNENDQICGVLSLWDIVADWHCAMIAYAEHFGKWSEYHQNYTYQSLYSAQLQLGLSPRRGHSALEDCQACLSVIRRMAGIVIPEIK